MGDKHPLVLDGIVFMMVPGVAAAILQPCGVLRQQVREGRRERCKERWFLLLLAIESTNLELPHGRTSCYMRS